MNQSKPFSVANLSREFDSVDAIHRRFKQIPEHRDLALALLYGFLKRSVERDFTLSEHIAALSERIAALEKRHDTLEAALATLGLEAVLGESPPPVPEPPTGE